MSEVKFNAKIGRILKLKHFPNEIYYPKLIAYEK